MHRCRKFQHQVIWGMLAFFCAGLTHAQTYSDLWGIAGERWQTEGRLPDFSYAGYHFGEDPLPDVPVVTDVTRFGAKGDGKTDCTQAFIDVVAATEKGAILIPPGKYVIRDIIWIKKPNIVLRGAGPGKTILLPTTELEDIRPNMGHTTSGRPTSNYSWSGGFIWAQGSYRERTLAKIVSECARGSHTLVLDKAQDLKPGQRISVSVRDDDKQSLLDYIYSGDAGDTRNMKGRMRVQMVSRIASVDGKTITLERPLRFDVRKSWSPVLRSYDPTVSEVGIENLSIDFPVKPYAGHFTERGLNGIAMNGTSDCWIRNVQISNCDSAVYLSGFFSTINGLLLDATRPDHKGTTGHHGISLGSDCLVTRFVFQTHFIHDVTLSGTDSGNVIKNGKGINLSLDHHRKGPFENLFCKLHVGKGREIWRCGGGRGLGKHCAARGTFWCIEADQDLSWPSEGFGPDSMNLVGLRTSDPSIKDPDGKWFEAIPPDLLVPADLHAAQLERRLRQKAASE